LNIFKNPDFYAFLFEMWCASRRSEKIRKELQSCISKVVDAIREILEEAWKNSMVKFDAQKSDERAKALLALSDGIAFHMLINPSENLKDKKFWLAIRNMMLGVLKSDRSQFMFGLIISLKGLGENKYKPVRCNPQFTLQECP
jgi:BetI-type transcriptional repressor, C-terminal